MTPWWNNGIVYHLYIKSFFDSEGTGIGGLKGVTRKLDYLQDLGIDAIWLSPFFDSPMRDNGYDIKDYLHVNPLFGTDQDLDELFAQMKRRKLKIIIDLVLNHTSKDHPWFQQALKDPKSPYRDYYIFKDKSAINNARSIFGNSTWEPVGDNQYYYHTFAVEQPELNWENPALRAEIHAIINHWLNKGVDGFRLDAITFIKKDPAFPSLEPDDKDGLFSCTKTSLNQPGILDFLNEMREKTWNDREIYTIGEAPGVTYEQLPLFISPKGILTSVFDFSYTDIDITGDNWSMDFAWTYDEFQRRLDHMQLNTQKVGTAATYLENHDNPRSLNKFFKKYEIDSKDHFRMATGLHMFYLFLRGTAFEYQGQEIGTKNIKFKSVDEADDLQTYDQYERALKNGMSAEDALRLINVRSRDHSRFPVFWSEAQLRQKLHTKPFVTDAKAYGIDPVDVQDKDADSVLNFVKALIKFKKSPEIEEFLIRSVYEALPAHAGIVGYKRVLGNQEMTILINMTDEVKTVKLPTAQVAASNNKRKAFDGTLEAYESVILTRF